MPKISVVIPFYNCPYIQYAIESLISQIEKDYEIIVVDDGSTCYAELLDPYEKYIRYFKKENGGTATALNEGIKQAKGEYFTWLSSDDLYLPAKLSKQVQHMESEQADICYTSANIIGQTNKERQNLFFHQFNNYQDFLMKLSRRCIIHGNSVMMKMDVFSNIGVFNEEYRYTHDYEMWLRAALHYHFYHIPEALVQYRIHEGMGTNKYKEDIVHELKKLRRKYIGRFDNGII
ncbi:glycosyltransferase family 2 protein [Cytobacillus gottheilii]|uniref:glycosyltransferase family 2 protein n=1 Tax=Cytobacillus gottheilii TaxID=859144 RepID=UPI003CE9C7A9